MRVGVLDFVPGRLTEAREARRIPSMSALARKLSVSASTISRWEDGSNFPDAEALANLSKELGVRPEFFLRPLFLSDRPVFFRSLSSTLVRDIEYQHSQMHWLQEISAVIGHYVDFPAIDMPDVIGNTSYRQLRDEDIERIAVELRQHWKMGEGPCPDIVAQMERVGFIIGSIEMGTARLDGLCNWSPDDDRPHVLLATDKMAFARRQMDAAHEMAHAVLHRSVTAGELKKDLKLIESQAFRLASAFLLPATTFPLEVGAASLGKFAALKERWRVSIKAQIKRLVDLETITPDHATYLYKLYSARGWSREEPLDREWPLQQPRVLADSLHLIVDSGLRRKPDLLAVEFTMSAGDVENLCNLPAGWFFSEAAEVVHLKVSETLSRGDRLESSAVVPFRKRPHK